MRVDLDGVLLEPWALGLLSDDLAIQNNSTNCIKSPCGLGYIYT